MLFTGKICLSVFAVENGVSPSCKFRFFSGVFELPYFRSVVRNDSCFYRKYYAYKLAANHNSFTTALF